MYPQVNGRKYTWSDAAHAVMDMMDNSVSWWLLYHKLVKTNHVHSCYKLSSRDSDRVHAALLQVSRGLAVPHQVGLEVAVSRLGVSVPVQEPVLHSTGEASAAVTQPLAPELGEERVQVGGWWLVADMMYI